jgi:hypothetical protein
MRKLIGCILLIAAMLSVRAQQKGFVFLEASNRQPFYVLHAGQVYSSSSNGYLLMNPGVRDTIDCIIGFPRERWKRKRYRVPVISQDCYWQWMQVDSGHWALYDRVGGRWVREEAEKINGAESEETEGMSLDALSDWLEKPATSELVAMKTNQKRESTESRWMSLEQGWLTRYEDAGDSVWVWLPKEEGKIMRRELGEEKRWVQWTEEDRQERDWEAELRRVRPERDKKNKQQSGWKE